jgi:alpha-mannosidase
MIDSATASPLRNPSATDRISAAIAQLRRLTQLNVQSGWRSHWGDFPTSQAPEADSWQSWAAVSLNDRGHVAWDKGEKVLWLGQRVVVPPQLQGYAIEGLTLRLDLGWWAIDTQIYVNGELVQQGDLFDASTRILLSPSATAGDAFNVAIRLVSPGHDPGALVRSLCQYERADHSLNPPEPSFVADELAVLQTYLATFAPEQLEAVAAATDRLPWAALDARDRARFDRGLTALRHELQPFSAVVKQRQIQLLGHAHLDLAWLWPVSDTWQAAERTFQSVLQLQQAFPELTFGHSTPALYAWMEINRPELFAAIQRQVAAGRWEIIAGLWIEPELNLVNGESIARQVLYGQRYVQEKFGKVSKIAWLPDTFGFCWQLPQILQQGEIEYFVTQKLRWNDTTQFPYELFWWQAPDGSTILSLNSAPIGEGIDPVKMAQYSCMWETKTASPTALWLPGVGDHGGGPSRDMLEVARRWQQSPFFPTIEFTTVPESAHRFVSFHSPTPHLERRTLSGIPSRLLHHSRRSEMVEPPL